MRVLITLPVKIGFDGMTKQVLSLCKYMDKQDVEIDLLSCRGYDPKMKPFVEEAGFSHVYRMEYRDTKRLKYFIGLWRLIRRRKYDIVHANGQSATLAVEMLAAQLAGCKVRIAHSHNSMCLHKKAHRILKPLFKMTYNDAIACSKEAGEWLFEGKQYWLLNNGIDVDAFAFDEEKRKEYRKKLCLAHDDVAIGHVGAFEPWKNHCFLLEVFDELKKRDARYKLFLFGIDGSTKESILAKISQLELEKNVFYCGTTDRMADYLQAMDLMLLPSWYEGFPVTTVEWQANGLPCLISDTVKEGVMITDLVRQLPINQGSSPWIDTIIQYDNSLTERVSARYPEEIKAAGFDIRSNAAELKEHYLHKLSRMVGKG